MLLSYVTNPFAILRSRQIILLNLQILGTAQNIFFKIYKSCASAFLHIVIANKQKKDIIKWMYTMAYAQYKQGLNSHNYMLVPKLILSKPVMHVSY